MTASMAPRTGPSVRAERRLLVQLSVAAISMATLAVSWLGISGVEQSPAVAQPVEMRADAATTGTLTTLVPASASSRATTVRRSRAS